MNQYGGIYVPSQDNQKLKESINWFIDNSKISKITRGVSGIVYSITLNEDKRQETPFFSLNFNSYKEPVTTLLMKMCVVLDKTKTSSEEYVNLTKDAIKHYNLDYVLKNEFIDEINIQTDIYLKTIEYLQPICPAIVYAGIYGDVKNNLDLNLLRKLDIKRSLTASPTIGCIFMEFAEDYMSGYDFYDLLDVKTWRNTYQYLLMYMLIQLSLNTGYTHGDHHLGNFMINTTDKTYIEDITARPIIIDFGRSTKIPPTEMAEFKRLCSEHNYNDALQILCKKPVANDYVSNPQFLKSHFGWACGIHNDNQMMTMYLIKELNDTITNFFQARERQIDRNVSKMNQLHEQEPEKYPLLPLSNAEKNKLFPGLIGGFRKRRNYNKKRNVTRRRRFTKRRARKTHNRRTRYGY